jgi:hypothetical protein
MCTLKKPFDADNVDGLYMKIKAADYDPISYSEYSYDLINVISRCLSPRHLRISLDELM